MRRDKRFTVPEKLIEDVLLKIDKISLTELGRSYEPEKNINIYSKANIVLEYFIKHDLNLLDKSFKDKFQTEKNDKFFSDQKIKDALKDRNANQDLINLFCYYAYQKKCTEKQFLNTKTTKMQDSKTKIFGSVILILLLLICFLFYKNFSKPNVQITDSTIKKNEENSPTVNNIENQTINGNVDQSTHNEKIVNNYIEGNENVEIVLNNESKEDEKDEIISLPNIFLKKDKVEINNNIADFTITIEKKGIVNQAIDIIIYTPVSNGKKILATFTNKFFKNNIIKLNKSIDLCLENKGQQKNYIFKYELDYGNNIEESNENDNKVNANIAPFSTNCVFLKKCETEKMGWVKFTSSKKEKYRIQLGLKRELPLYGPHTISFFITKGETKYYKRKIDSYYYFGVCFGKGYGEERGEIEIAQCDTIFVKI